MHRTPAYTHSPYTRACSRARLCPQHLLRVPHARAACAQELPSRAHLSTPRPCASPAGLCHHRARNHLPARARPLCFSHSLSRSVSIESVGVVQPAHARSIVVAGRPPSPYVRLYVSVWCSRLRLCMCVYPPHMRSTYVYASTIILLRLANSPPPPSLTRYTHSHSLSLSLSTRHPQVSHHHSLSYRHHPLRHASTPAEERERESPTPPTDGRERWVRKRGEGKEGGMEGRAKKVRDE